MPLLNALWAKAPRQMENAAESRAMANENGPASRIASDGETLSDAWSALLVNRRSEQQRRGKEPFGRTWRYGRT